MKPHTMRRRLTTLLVTWLVILFVALFALAATWQQRAASEADEQRLLLAQAVAGALDAVLAPALQAASKLPDEIGTPGTEARGELHALRLASPFRHAVYVVDDAGSVLVADPPGVEPLPRELLPSKPGTTGVFVKPGGGAFAATIVPIERGGRSLWLVAEMATSDAPIRRLVPRPDPGGSLHLVVVDTDGRLIAADAAAETSGRLGGLEDRGDELATREPFVVRGVTCPVAHEGLESVEHAAAIAPLELAPWFVAALQAESGPRIAARRLTRDLALAAGVCLIAGLVLAYALSRSVVTPLAALSRQTETLRGGDLTRPIDVRGDLEIELLSKTLEEARTRLAATLGELETLNLDLEEQVRQRTRSLERQGRERRRLVRRLMGAAEEERRRIARELHDEIAQLLTVIGLKLDRLPGESEEVRETRRHLDEAQREIHRVIHDLRPSLLDDLGLASAIASHAATHLEPHGVEVALELDETLELSPEVSVALFRIFQELITNVLRHAEAERVTIELYERDGSAVLAVEDDGKGFDERKRHRGAGLVGILERAALVGGAVEVDSEPRQGTSVSVSVPLDDRSGESRDGRTP